jgi:hypothetical protein
MNTPTSSVDHRTGKSVHDARADTQLEKKIECFCSPTLMARKNASNHFFGSCVHFASYIFSYSDLIVIFVAHNDG